MLTRGVILVGNKTDLERHREVQTPSGRKLAKDCCCKFIETSSGLDHNVNELLVGIVAQVKLNPKRINNLTEKQRLNLITTIPPHRRPMERPRHRMSKISSRSSESSTDQPDLKPKSTVLMKHSKNNGSDSDDEDESVISSEIEMKILSNNSPSRLGEASCSTAVNNVQKSYESSPNQSPKKTNLVQDDKNVSKFSNRTKLFLTSFLKFKRTLRVKRRNSNSCNDLFVI